MKCIKCGQETTNPKYCSRSCANKYRSFNKKNQAEIKHILPEQLTKIMELDSTGVVANELLKLFEEEDIRFPLPNEFPKTSGNYILNMDGREYRPSEAMSYEIIEQMLKSGVVMFIVDMKRASIISPFKNPRTYNINCVDQELSQIVKASLDKTLAKTMLDISYSALVYGIYVAELLWEYKTKYELGLSKSQNAQNLFTVGKVPATVYPRTLSSLRRTKTGEFNGFIQAPINPFLNLPEVVVPVQDSLVVPYNGHFGNLYGKSLLEGIYPIWFWYNVILLSMARYMERQGTPVTIARAPSKGKVRIPGTTKREDAMVLALDMAATVAHSNAVVMPSDRDEDGNYLYDLEYLKAPDSSNPFTNVLSHLTQEMFRSGMTADNSIAQTQTGSFNTTSIHRQATNLHNEMISIEFLHYINKYYISKYSLYNRGINGPPVYLETATLDVEEKEMLMKLFNIAGNSQSFQDALMRVDWAKLAELQNIPTLSDAELATLKKALIQESLEKQKLFTPGFDKSEKNSMINENPQNEDQKTIERLEKTWEYYQKGHTVPILLTKDELNT